MSNKGAYDHLVKLMTLGDSGVGKSSILMRFVDDMFTPAFMSTIGIDYKIKTISHEGKKIKLQMWDTAGQERFRGITNAYYRGAMGIILVYDIGDEKSFRNIRTWLQTIEAHGADSVEKILLGNKIDMRKEDPGGEYVKFDKAQELAKTFNMEAFEVSAKTGEGINEAFDCIVRNIKKSLLVMDPLPTKTIIPTATPNDNKACCNK